MYTCGSHQQISPCHWTTEHALEDMSGHVFPCNRVLSDAILVTTHLIINISIEVNSSRAWIMLYQCEDLQGSLIDLAAAVRNHAYNDLLPAFGTPCF